MSDAAVARLALGISLVVAAWQVAQYMLSGGRVRVTLLPGMLTEYRLFTAKSWSDIEAWMKAEGGWPLEVAVIDIENLGRQGVTISEVSLHLRSRYWWIRRRRRRTLSPMPWPAPNAETEPTRRLEPFDRARYVLDVGYVLRPAPGRWGGAPVRPLRVRAWVRVAGKRRGRVSSWRRGWRVVDGQIAFAPGLLELALEAHRSMTRRARGDDAMQLHCIPVALKVRDRFDGRAVAPTADELEQVIRESWLLRNPDQPFTAGIIAFDMARDLAPLFPESVEAAPSPRG